MRMPRFTPVSEGNPLRRLLMTSKARQFFVVDFIFAHDDLHLVDAWFSAAQALPLPPATDGVTDRN